jgi:hypothetical protein
VEQALGPAHRDRPALGRLGMGMTPRRDDSGGGVILGGHLQNGHIALVGLNYSFWCRIVWDSVVVNLSL